MMMAGFKYWEDCILNLDMEAMWLIPDVSSEWESAGETRGHKVRFSRDPQGQPYLTQTEMRVMPSSLLFLQPTPFFSIFYSSNLDNLHPPLSWFSRTDVNG
ncbi:hypothetical protein MLD38_027052 [Melastoma candidum]|uniref:Uncharacterized protein n=1 Tax=Melastoma candidum TaxID=119954 RepID=A0ACB9P3D7_9MYRT|nr:hypothetical protein MLD38_027052 [Melastoma candidum]